MPIVTPVDKWTTQVGHTQHRTNKCVHISYLYQICAKTDRQSCGKTLRSMRAVIFFYLRIIKLAECTAILLWPTILT
jgi:hypothetical protein